MSERQSDVGPQILVESLNLHLPAGFEERADSIAREVSRQLLTLPIERSVRLDVVNVPKLRLQGGETNGVIARRIVKSIHAQITAPPLLNQEPTGERYD